MNVASINTIMPTAERCQQKSDENSEKPSFRRNILIVSNDDFVIDNIEQIIKQTEFVSFFTHSGSQALEMFEAKLFSYILVDVNLKDMPSEQFISIIRGCENERHVPIIALASSCDEKRLSNCADSGCDDYLFAPFNLLSLNTRINSLEQIRDLKYLYNDSINEQLVAKNILHNALEERSIKHEEIGLLSKSKSVFSGDFFLTARHPDGSLNILLADFTGHGLSAAIGALPVADVFNTMTKKGFTLDYILENINSKLYTLLPTSMFMACSALSISSDLKYVNVWNGGMPDIYIRAFKTGNVIHKIQSSHIPLGIDEEILNRYKLEQITIAPGDQLILYTDGLTDAMNAENNMYGYHHLENCLLMNKNDDVIFGKIVESFSGFCGDIEPMDDVTIACVPCTEKLMQASVLND